MIITKKTLETAKPGTSVVYYTGKQVFRCKPDILEAVRRLCDAGVVELVQRRVPKGFDYIAQFRRTPQRDIKRLPFASRGL